MPEGPEVRIYAEHLSKFLVGKSLLSLEVFDDYRRQFHQDENVELGKDVVRVGRYGKMFWFEFSTGNILSFQLGMTGTVRDSRIQNDEHLRATLTFCDQTFYFYDARKFGRIHFGSSMAHIEAKLKRLGPDVFDSSFLNTAHISLLKPRNANKTLHELLLDQRVFAGVGNYLRSEILYEARLSPWRVLKTMAVPEMKRLIIATAEVCERSYQAGGLSMRDYIHIDGKRGNYKNEIRVYQKKVDPLGNTILAQVDKNNRRFFWVPEVQS